MAASSIAINYGHNGATTSSFQSGGDWAKVLGEVTKYAPTSTVYVTIQVSSPESTPPRPPFVYIYMLQKERRSGSDNSSLKFGHNDMKLADYVETFKANLRQMVADVKQRGGKPVMTIIPRFH